MLYKFRAKANKKWFDFRCRSVLSGPPLKTKPDDVAIVTMMCHADLIMYLISIKSFYSQLGHGRIVILNDGSLDRTDLDILNHQLSSPEIIPISRVSTGSCPKGGCWERLALVTELNADNYVVQLDADIVTNSRIPEVELSIKSQKSFTLGTPQGLKFSNLNEASAFVKESKSTHVQTQAEMHFQNLPRSDVRQYVRGCAGFTGFSKGSIQKSDMESFSLEMASGIGNVWNNWGSEQVTSNYLISNSPGAQVLPFPRYASYEPGVDSSGSALLHFYGPFRFSNGEYIRRSREYLRSKKPNA